MQKDWAGSAVADDLFVVQIFWEILRPFQFVWQKNKIYLSIPRKFPEFADDFFVV